MHQQINDGALNGDTYKDYLAYTTQIFDMVAMYTWKSILEYDHLYRENQAQYGFRWGTYTPHISLTLTHRPQIKPSTTRRNQMRNASQAPTAPTLPQSVVNSWQATAALVPTAGTVTLNNPWIVQKTTNDPHKTVGIKL